MKRLTAGACGMAIVVALGVAGCGGGDSTTDTSTASALSTDQFVSQANAICAAGNKMIDAAAQKAYAGAQPTEAETLKLATDVVIPSVQQQVNAISELPVPAGDEDQVAAILDAAQQGIREATADPASLTSGKADPFAEANKLAPSTA